LRVRTISLAAALLLLACTKPDVRGRDGLETLSLRYEGSANIVTLPELAEDLGYLSPVKLEYVGNNSTGGPHSIQAVVSGDTDFGNSFNGAIIKLIAAKAPLRCVVASYGTDEQQYSGFYALDTSQVRGPADFVGKHVSLNTLGAHAEFALREYLARGGVSADQVTMVPLPLPNGELALRNRQVEVAHMALIFREKALARGGVHKVFSDYDLWGAFNAGSHVMSTRFLAKNPNTARKFVQAVGKAVAWTKSQPREVVVARMKQIIHKRKRHEDTSAVHYWRSFGVATPHGELHQRDFAMWIEWLVKDGQLAKGQLKPSDVYSNEYQAPGTLADAQ
jgi:ABC-type nitrate/sulfonate/bicarbonate transport system substrate-binding protein